MRQVIICTGKTGGCVRKGETLDETIANIKEAIDFYIDVLTEDHQPVPQEILSYDQQTYLS